MYFDILVLRVLADGSRHGYEIKKSVERILGGRSINNNVLYPALRRFEEQGAIRRVAAEADPGRPPRNVYQLTDTGSDLLQAMIRDASPALMADENEFQTRVSFFADMAVADRLAMLGVRREILQSRLAHLQSLRPDAVATPWGMRVLDFNIDRYRQELAWLDELASAVTALARQRGRPVRRGRRDEGARTGPVDQRADRLMARAGTASTLGRVIFLAGPMLSMIDSSVVNVAVPVIVTSLHTTLSAASWTVSGYLLGLGGGLAATPWLARRFGTLRAYTAVLAGFTLASACCALAPTVGVLIAARVVQGLVAAPMVPLAMGRLVSDSETRRNIPASFGIVFFAAPALGPALGGLLIGQFGWRSVFLINLPVGLAALAGTLVAGRAERRQPNATGAADLGARLDLRGMLLLGAGLALAIYGASQGARGWFTAGSAPAWMAGLALILGYSWHARRLVRHGGYPAVNLSLLGSPRRVLILALECVASVVLFAVLFLAPVFLQDIQHHSAAVTGLVLLPQGVVMGLASWLGSIVVDRGQARPAIVAWSVIGGLTLLAASTLGMLLLGPGSPLWLTAALLSGRGVALGLTIQPLVMALLGDLDKSQVADGNTLFNIAERLAGSFGIALLATFYETQLRLTGSAVGAWHDCVLVLAAMSVVGALAATALGTGGGTRVLMRR